MEQQAQRRLAAVLAADVAGYTRLMRIDEEGTINTWWSYRREIIDPILAEHSGRIVKLTGDGFLAEFVSATNAVLAAHAIQKTIEPRVKDQPDDKRMLFRMGVNLGDIYWDDEDIYGDDVNIAARLEGIADPGSILISKTVFDNVKRSARLTFENRGDQTLKNISEPIQAYRVVGELEDHTLVTGDPEVLSGLKKNIDKPNSLAVLPFAVFGNDPEQEYFADGFTDDLITELARFSQLFVISRNASFALKGQNIDLREVGEQMFRTSWPILLFQ
jgi:adenylate cyclase